MLCQMNSVWTELYTGDPEFKAVEKEIEAGNFSNSVLNGSQVYFNLVDIQIYRVQQVLLQYFQTRLTDKPPRFFDQI